MTVTNDAFRKGSEAILAAREKLADAKAVLLDWDGCLAYDNRLVPEAIRFLREWEGRVAIVSNNSTNLPDDFVAVLNRAGLSIPGERIVLAGLESLRRAQEFHEAPTMLLADSRMKAQAKKMGIRVVRDNASVILLMRDVRLTYMRIERAANSIRSGARLIVSNPDASHQGANGKIVPETGALLAALEACLGEPVHKREIIGKPQDRLFKAGCSALNVRPSEVVMLGDNPATDAAGARACGMPHILIGREGGVEFGDLMYAKSQHRPAPAVLRAL